MYITDSGEPLDDIVTSVAHDVTLQHLLHLVPLLSGRAGPHVHVLTVEVPPVKVTLLREVRCDQLPVEELLHWAAEEAGEPADLTQVTHVPHGGGRGGDQQQRQQQGRHHTEAVRRGQDRLTSR